MTRVKICGITSVDDAHLAVELGAWALGLIFYPRSPRRCRLDEAESVSAELRRRVELVGVFHNAPLEEVAAIAEGCRLSILQLHGDEGPAFCREIARRTGCRVAKAVRVRSAADVRGLQPFHTDYHLLDTWVAGRPGGTGATFNWELARAHRRTVPLILSGGLDAGNVTEAVRAVGPYAVDSASGTERTPGQKDPARLRAFFDAVALADGRLAAPGEPVRDHAPVTTGVAE